MSLLKSVVLLCLVAFVAGTVYKPKPFKRYQPNVVPAISSKARNHNQLNHFNPIHTLIYVCWFFNLKFVVTNTSLER